MASAPRDVSLLPQSPVLGRSSNRLDRNCVRNRSSSSSCSHSSSFNPPSASALSAAFEPPLSPTLATLSEQSIQRAYLQQPLALHPLTAPTPALRGPPDPSPVPSQPPPPPPSEAVAPDLSGPEARHLLRSLTTWTMSDVHIGICPLDDFSAWLTSWSYTHPSPSAASLYQALVDSPTPWFQLWVPWSDDLRGSIPADGYCGYYTHWYLSTSSPPPLPLVALPGTRLGLARHLRSVCPPTVGTLLLHHGVRRLHQASIPGSACHPHTTPHRHTGGEPLLPLPYPPRGVPGAGLSSRHLFRPRPDPPA